VTATTRLSPCPTCGKPGSWGFDDDWCHHDSDAAMTCPREGWCPGEPEPDEAFVVPDEDMVAVDDGEFNGLDTWEF
jgi:hypothetical protein